MDPENHDGSLGHRLAGPSGRQKTVGSSASKDTRRREPVPRLTESGKAGRFADGDLSQGMQQAILWVEMGQNWGHGAVGNHSGGDGDFLCVPSCPSVCLSVAGFAFFFTHSFGEQIGVSWIVQTIR